MPKFQPLAMIMMMRNSRATPSGRNGSYLAARVSALGRPHVLAATLLALAVLTACSPAAEPTRTPASTSNANANVVATRTGAGQTSSSTPPPPPTATAIPATTAPSPAIPPSAAQPTVAPTEGPGSETPVPTSATAPLSEPSGSCGDLCTEEFWEAGATVALVRAELEQGADPLARNDDGTPALAFAVGFGALPEVVGLLLEAGADPNAVDDYSGVSPLHVAAMLSAYTANPEARSQVPGDAGNLAENTLKSMELLLEHGADAGARDKYGQSALLYYLADLVGRFRDGGESADPVGPDLRVVQLLLSPGAVITEENDTDRVLLQYAMMVRSEPEVIGLLLDHGAGAAAMAAGDHHLGTPLHMAATFNPDPRVFELLLKRGEDVAAPGPLGRTALHLLALVGDAEPEAVWFLLDHGADVNARGQDGETPLHYAASHSGPDIVKVLLERGADVSARDQMTNTPLHAAVTDGYLSGAWRGIAGPEVIGLLLKAGAEANARGDGGETALHLAAWHQDAGVAGLLVDGGGDVNAVDEWGRTPLHRAAEFRETWHQGPDVDLAFVRMLLELGADVAAKDHEGQTACDLARSEDPDLRSLLC